MGAHLIMDTVSRAYISIAVVWSVILCSAMGFLWHHRQLPQLQMRRLPLVFTALTILHIYWTLCMIGHVFAPLIPCAAEYWVMSLLLPFGIALFQAVNTQFLCIASRQRYFKEPSSLTHLAIKGRIPVLNGQKTSFPRMLSRFLVKVDGICKMVAIVGLGIIMQAFLAVLVFLLSRKFHAGFGITPANVFGYDQAMQCSRGWEWWPSIIWQVFWAWIYGPRILWKSRNIHDIHGWRLQTILCCLASLPATPLWLCGIYLPQFAPVNAIFGPPNWFAASIFVIQLLTVSIPCYQVHRHYSLRTSIFHTITHWETNNNSVSSGSIDDEATAVDWSSNCSYARRNSEKAVSILSDRTSIDVNKHSHLYTIVALEWTLLWNPIPLQEFAALKDFSGENIAFLTLLAKWRKVWRRRDQTTLQPSMPSHQDGHYEELVSEDLRRQAYNSAMCLYCVLVSHEYAEFPLNLCCQTLQRLDAIFAQPANVLLGGTPAQSTVNVAAPFAADANKPITTREVEEIEEEGVGTTGVLRLHGLYYQGVIPVEFTRDCFNGAEEEIKYLVLTNTWPRFVQAGLAEQIRDPEGRSLTRRLAQHFRQESRR